MQNMAHNKTMSYNALNATTGVADQMNANTIIN